MYRLAVGRLLRLKLLSRYKPSKSNYHPTIHGMGMRTSMISLARSTLRKHHYITRILLRHQRSN